MATWHNPDLETRWSVLRDVRRVITGALEVERAAKTPPPAFLSGVSYAGSPASLVAVGLAGTFVSADSGDSWVQVDSVALNTVKFLGKNGWAVGPRGRVARWTPMSP